MQGSRPSRFAMHTILVVCCLIFAAGSAFAQQNYKVYLQSEVFTPSANFSSQSASGFTAFPHEVHNGRYRRLIQFWHLPGKREHAKLRDLDVQLEAYIDFGAYIASVPATFQWSTLLLFDVRSVQPIKPEWKTNRRLLEQPWPDYAWDGRNLSVIVSFAPDVDIESGARLLRAEGYSFRETLPNPALAYVQVRPEQVAELAALPYVSFVEPIPPAPEVEDEKGRALHRANLVDSESSIGPKFTGAGVAVLVRDDGAVGPHIDFQGRLNNIADEYGSTHGDGVSGILCGAGNLDPEKRGMAAGADLYVIDYVNHFQDNTIPLHQNKGVKVTNSSYSDGCNTGYTATARTVDGQLFQNPTLMHIFSGGNSNGSNCNYGAGNQWGNITGGHKQAKNAIACANLNQMGELDNTSSRGPAHDGRLKPDIAANGTGHTSTDEDNEYLTFGGTSGAAPGIAGCMTQLIEAYRTFNSGSEAPTALLKAIMLNTANDLGNVGPDYKFGWGHVNGGRALRALQNNWFGQNTIGQGGELTIPIQVPADVRSMRVMVYWPESAAVQMASKALINDLDITLITPAQTTHLPWKLNPTADPNTLNMPAGRGRDSLNNIEQVALGLPEPGTYQLVVKGTAVPMGNDVAFYYVYDFTTEPLKVTYPNGGEGLYPGQNIHIQWDAEPGAGQFELKYSTDKGQSWSSIASKPAAARLHAWTIPQGISSGEVLISVERGTERDQSDTTFGIMPQVQGFKLLKVCPDSVTVGWDSHATATGFEAYALGQKYMEIVGAAPGTDNSLTFYRKVSLEPLWLSIRPLIHGAPGRRINAQTYPGQLLNCPQDLDYAVAEITQPPVGGVFGCDLNSDRVQVRIQNQGLQSVSGLTVSFQIDQQPPVTEDLPDLAPNTATLYTFNQPMVFSVNGLYKLKVWVTAPGDPVSFNDTLSQLFSVSTHVQAGYFTQDFEGASFPPTGYRIVNPDEGVTWDRTTQSFGPNGTSTKAIWVNHFNYNKRGESDHFFVIPIDLSSKNNAALEFDLAHAGYSNDYSDGLRVSVYPGCSLTSTPIVFFEKFGSALNTTPNQSTSFSPDQAADWSHVTLDISNFAGSKAIVVFTAINDYGNNTYLDNISVKELQLIPPVASITADADTICRLDTVVFSAPATPFVNYTWNFGSNVLPTTTATGPGPHSRVFITPGDKMVRLIASSHSGRDTAFHPIVVQALPNASFTKAINQNTVTFTATNNSATQWLWNFGDGNSSTLRNPIHTYAAVGDYVVSLDATNTCKTDTRTETITINTVSTNEAFEEVGIKILPNPNTGHWVVSFTRQDAADLQIRLLSADGRELRRQNLIHHGNGLEQLVYFHESALAAGVYWLEVRTDSEITRGLVLIQH